MRQDSDGELGVPRSSTGHLRCVKQGAGDVVRRAKIDLRDRVRADLASGETDKIRNNRDGRHVLTGPRRHT